MAAPTPVLSTILESRDYIIVKCTIPTGGDADISASRVITLSAFTTSRAATAWKIKRVECCLVGFSVILLQDATTDVHLLSLNDRMDISFDKIPFPMASAAGTTGNINFTTVGIGTTDHGHFILHLLKVE
jgi:hypothetical protein